MHAPKEWYDRFEIENGQIVRVLTAEWYHKNHPEDIYTCDVYKENDAGESWEQNLYQSMWGGHCVAFPGLPKNEKSYWYYDSSIAELEGWQKRQKKSTVGWSTVVMPEDIEKVCELYPDFKYLADKYEISNKSELMEKLEIWIEHHELEILLAAGFEKIGMNKTFWKLTPKNRKATIQFMRQNPGFINLNLKELREAMRSDNPVLKGEYFRHVKSWYRPDKRYHSSVSISYEDFKYIKKARKKFNSTYENEDQAMKQLIELYRDYKCMLQRSDHPQNDEYWLYPSDLNEFHNRLVEEERIKEEARRLAEEKAEAKKNKERKKAFRRIVKKFEEFNGTVDGYSIFVTDDYNEWQKQAHILHQCICASGYYQGTADGNYTIVFIQKNGKPIATAQVYTNGNIGQFYANELDRVNCKPSKEVAEAFNKWLDSVPKSKFQKKKPRQRKSAKKEVAA